MRKHSDSVDYVPPRNVANPGASRGSVVKPTNPGSKSTKSRPVTGEKGKFSSHSVRSDQGGG
jgi:hypothetical protein